MIPRPDTTPDRGLSPLIGTSLMLVILFLLATVFGVMAIGTTELLPEKNVELYVEIDESDAGLKITPRQITHPVDIKLNGVTIMRINESSKHEIFLLPVAPDDNVYFVADIGRQKVLRQMHIDKHRAADFIAYYTFEEQMGNTISDQSPNQNDATINGASWTTDEDGSALSFDGSNDYATVNQLSVNSVESVGEFTVAIKYKITGDTGDIQQLVEHRNDSANFEWFVETVAGGNPHQIHYTVWQDGIQQNGVQSSDLANDKTHVAIGTYDGKKLKLYLNGEYIGAKSISGDVEMGELFIGSDAVDADKQYFQGNIYQFRLYYTAFDEDDVDILTKVMNAEAE